MEFSVVVVMYVKVGLNVNDDLVKVVSVFDLVKLKLVGRDCVKLKLVGKLCVKLKLMVGIVTVG